MALKADPSDPKPVLVMTTNELYVQLPQSQTDTEPASPNSNEWRQRRKDEEMSRGLHFPIALHPLATDDSRRVLGSSPNRRGARLRRRFRRNLRRKQDFSCVPAPFARASEAPRKCRPGYSWPPHLYQEHFKASSYAEGVSSKGPQTHRHPPKSSNEDSAASSGT